jgi:predicted KAP-like P-loop ATPase
MLKRLQRRKNESNSLQNYKDNSHKYQSKTNEHTSDSKTSSTIKIITDEPTLEDALDFDSYSQQLADIIVNSTPRFTIGVFGGWGTGKTTLMKMIEKKLKDNNRNDILLVWFDAWKYEKEKYLAIVPFIRTIELTVENKVAELEKKRE